MSKKKIYFLCFSLVALASLYNCSSTEYSSNLPDVVDFNYHIRPILSQNCYTCHGPDASSRKASLRLDTYEGATELLNSGRRAVAPRRRGNSEIIERINSDDPSQIMPPPESKKFLTETEKQLIARWIEQGAHWKDHWSFIHPSESPKPFQSIDHYIEKKLHDLGLTIAAHADSLTLLRRVSYTLTGLPPSLEEIEAMAEKPYEEVVDYYLASGHFGEHWARHWMDLVRYAEGMGHEFDFTIGGSWHYRDYLIRAFNDDVPYDLFVKEHLAGDMLAEPRISSDGLRNESVLGTAYAFLGEGKHSPVDIKKEEADRIDNLIDVTTKTFQGLTVSCAKCHDHKFDPIPTTDYYAMYGMFESSRVGPVAFQIPENVPHSESLHIASSLKDSIIYHLKGLDTFQLPSEHHIIGDFSTSNFSDWFVDGEAFTKGTLHTTFASSNPGMIGALRSPTFILQDSFIYVLAAGSGSTIRVIVDNFQLIQNPLHGSLSKSVDEEQWQIYKLDISSHKGHKAYVEILPGEYNTHKYGLKKTDFIDAKLVFSSNIDLKEKEISRAYKKWASSSEHYDSLYIMGLREGSAVNSAVFIRGSHKELSDSLVAHGFISVLESATAVDFPLSGSGRLAWAQSVVSSQNPLTARVIVNRIWHHLFSRALVESVDNFGLQGSLPSHPELLDHMAIEFMKNGWSIKSLIREILLSEVFRRSTKGSPANNEIDPENKYLATYPIRRLQAESVRDGIQAVTGQLDRTMYGEPIPSHLTEFMTGRGRPSVSGPMDGDGRRSIYTTVKRNFLSPMLLTFDMPIPFSTFGKRNVTNVPAQSLFLMNDPFVHEQVNEWARAIMTLDASREEKVIRIYRLAFCRNPNEEEISSGLKILDEFGGVSDKRAWKNYCHIIINMKEFIHLI